MFFFHFIFLSYVPLIRHFIWTAMFPGFTTVWEWNRQTAGLHVGRKTIDLTLWLQSFLQKRCGRLRKLVYLGKFAAIKFEGSALELRLRNEGRLIIFYRLVDYRRLNKCLQLAGTLSETWVCDQKFNFFHELVFLAQVVANTMGNGSWKKCDLGVNFLIS